MQVISACNVERGEDQLLPAANSCKTSIQLGNREGKKYIPELTEELLTKINLNWVDLKLSVCKLHTFYQTMLSLGTRKILQQQGAHQNTKANTGHSPVEYVWNSCCVSQNHFHRPLYFSCHFHQKILFTTSENFCVSSVG